MVHVAHTKKVKPQYSADEQNQEVHSHGKEYLVLGFSME